MSDSMAEISDKLSLKPPRGKFAGIIGAAAIPTYLYPDYFVGEYGMTKVSDRDIVNFGKYMLSLYESNEPHAGEFVRFANGALVRIAYVWHFCTDETTPCSKHNHKAEKIQTCVNGSIHMGNGFTSMSGSLDSGANFNTFSLTNELHLGSVWIWHDNWAGASRNVSGMVSLRVWESTAIPREYLPCGNCGCFWTSHTVNYGPGWHCSKHQQKCTKLYSPEYEKGN